MAEKYRPRTGDRVRVTIEGVVTDDYLDFEDDDGFEVEGVLLAHAHVNQEGVTVERIHEEFGPGDFVRARADAPDNAPLFGSDVRVIGHAGYLNLADGQWSPWGRGVPVNYFTSEYMERVDPSEAVR